MRRVRRTAVVAIEVMSHQGQINHSGGPQKADGCGPHTVQPAQCLIWPACVFMGYHV